MASTQSLTSYSDIDMTASMCAPRAPDATAGGSHRADERTRNMLMYFTFGAGVAAAAALILLMLHHAGGLNLG
jgi:hypothetical protein